LNSYKITNLDDATLDTDALNRQTGDSRYYLNTTTLNNITVPSNDVSINTYKLTNVADPVSNQDAATKSYVDANVGITQTFADGRYYLNSTTLDNITAPTGTLSMNS
jgi:hypothetical protein